MQIKTILEFDKNITSIIGPNGSGKSNITDAVRWVLGEQSMKTLRGSKLEDIIFSGTSMRKRMGFAEVNLVLDNEDQTFKLDYTEITITRRIFRTGNSEYMINMVPCRLKDIQELFYDTGIGRTGYSIISQGKIDEILSNKSEDRRQIFEEASGIMKYKMRKLESERKLQNTELNLLRIRDIIGELELMLDPLQEQSQTAKQFLKLRDSLKEIQINLNVYNVERLFSKLEKLNTDILDTNELIESKKNEQQNLKANDAVRLENIKNIENKIDEHKNELFSLQNSLEKVNSEISLLLEKSTNAKENIERYQTDISNFENEISIIHESKTKKSSKIESLKNQLQVFKNDLKKFEDEYYEIVKKLGEDEILLDKKKDLIMDSIDLLSDKKNQGYNVTNYISSLEIRKNDINKEILSLVSEKDMILESENEINNSLYITDSRMKNMEDDLNKKTVTRNELEEKLQEIKNKLEKLSSSKNMYISRKNILIDMEANLEGYSKSVKEIIKKSKYDADFKRGIHGALAQLVNVDKQYSVAIEISLGGALQNIVVEDEETAKKSIEFLKRNSIGRATFLPISKISGFTLSNDIFNKLKNENGFIDVASNLVDFENKYSNIINNLLGRTVIVDNIDNAIKISKVFKSSFRIVTLEGDLFNRGGQITGGSYKPSASNLLVRNSEIDNLEQKIIKLEKENKLLIDSFDEMSTLNNVLVEDTKELETNLNNLRIEFVTLQGQIKHTNESKNRIESRTTMLKNEILQIMNEIDTKKNESLKYVNEINDVQSKINMLKKEVEDSNKKQKNVQTRKDELHLDITDYKISVNSIEESINNSKENILNLEVERERLKKEIEKRIDYISQGENLILNNQDKTLGLKKQIENINQKIIGKRTNIERMSGEKENLDLNLKDTKIRLEELDLEIESLKDNKNKIEINKVKCDGEIEAIKNKLWDDYELTYINCKEMASPIDKVTVAQKNIESIKQQIKELGEVNINAIEEYKKTNERYNFLSTQLNDMEKAKEKLKRVINEMESIMKKQFMEQFNKINTIFNEVFIDLFLGGNASLKLVDESNVLESGIEINVQPPGKKLQNMMLLSGGEKAFTAIALLFSILKLKDTPFCILDEIDAALDDSNVDRFSEYLGELTQRTQFILVTHRKGTMENSDILYGVTVEEKGVSKIVSYDLKN